MTLNQAVFTPYRKWIVPRRSTWLLLLLMTALVLTIGTPFLQQTLGAAALWFLFASLGERLRGLARDGRHYHRAAPFAHVAAVVLLPAPVSILVNVSAATLGTRLAGGRWDPRYAFVVAGATGIASLVYESWGGITGSREVVWLALTCWVVVGLLYHVGFQVLVTQFSYRDRKASWWEAWKENFGQPTEYAAVSAMIVVSIMAILSSRSLGVGGSCLAVIPAYFVWDGWRRYMELERTHRRIIDAERLAAKGEMAGEIGHELNNYLAAISGRAQLMAMDRNISKEMEEEVERVRAAAMSMADLARGLMDMSQREARVERFSIAPMVRQTVDLIQPQHRFADITLHVQCDTPADLVMDPGQFQQLLLTLLKRSVQFGPRGEKPAVSLSTGLAENKSKIFIEVIRGRKDVSLEESHPEALRLRGGERELAGVRRIVERHAGVFVAQADLEGRQGYRITLPAALEA